jgi:hypothetical protein
VSPHPKPFSFKKKPQATDQIDMVSPIGFATGKTISISVPRGWKQPYRPDRPGMQHSQKRAIKPAELLKADKTFTNIGAEILEPVCGFQYRFVPVLLNKASPFLEEFQKSSVKFSRLCIEVSFLTHLRNLQARHSNGGSPWKSEPPLCNQTAFSDRQTI